MQRFFTSVQHLCLGILGSKLSLVYAMGLQASSGHNDVFMRFCVMLNSDVFIKALILVHFYCCKVTDTSFQNYSYLL